LRKAATTDFCRLVSQSAFRSALITNHRVGLLISWSHAAGANDQHVSKSVRKRSSTVGDLRVVVLQNPPLCTSVALPARIVYSFMITRLQSMMKITFHTDRLASGGNRRTSGHACPGRIIIPFYLASRCQTI